MKVEKNPRSNRKRRVHCSNEKTPNLSVQEAKQVNGEVITIFKALERCLVNYSV